MIRNENRFRVRRRAILAGGGTCIDAIKASSTWVTGIMHLRNIPDSVDLYKLKNIDQSFYKLSTPCGNKIGAQRPARIFSATELFVGNAFRTPPSWLDEKELKKSSEGYTKFKIRFEPGKDQKLPFSST
jgi:hypothetical protein